jgi:hypothetical protein
MISNALSYDADCIYRPNLFTRLSNNHPDVVHMLDNHLSAFIIPAVHIRNHKEACWYTYGGAYTPCIGHFFGETAEMIWPFMNQFAGQIRQMTNGHRQDTIIRNLGAWNWCKVQRIGIFPTPLLKSWGTNLLQPPNYRKSFRRQSVYMKRSEIICGPFAKHTQQSWLYGYHCLGCHNKTAGKSRQFISTKMSTVCFFSNLAAFCVFYSWMLIVN